VVFPAPVWPTIATVFPGFNGEGTSLRIQSMVFEGRQGSAIGCARGPIRTFSVAGKRTAGDGGRGVRAKAHSVGEAGAVTLPRLSPLGADASRTAAFCSGVSF